MNKLYAYFAIGICFLNSASTVFPSPLYDLKETDRIASIYVAENKNSTAGRLQQAILRQPGLDVTEPEVTYQVPLFKTTRMLRQIQSAENLHLYGIINQISLYLKSTVDNLVQDGAHADDLRPILAASILCTQSLDSIKRIVTLFNTSTLEDSFQFERYFVNLCNALKEHGNSVKPRHLRQFGERLKKFENLVCRYFYKQKEFMLADERELFNEMNLLCYRLRFCLLREEFYDFSFVDLLVDQCIFKPAEWVADHKLITAATVISASLIFYFYIYPKMYPPNPTITVVGDCFKQGEAECCLLAIANAIALKQPNKAAIFKDTLPFNMARILGDARAELAGNPAALARLPEHANWLNGENAILILQEPAIMRRLCGHMGVPFNADDPSQGIRVIQGDEFSQTADTFQQIIDVDEGLARREQQFAICYQGNSQVPGHGHWLATRFIPNRLGRQNIKVEVADSLRSFNPLKDLTWDPSLLNARMMFMNRVLPLAVTDALRAVNASNNLYAGARPGISRQEIANNSFSHYAQALQALQATNDHVLTQQHGKAYLICQQMFDHLRTLATTDQGRRQIVPIAIEGHGQPLYLEQVQTFAEFKTWLGL